MSGATAHKARIAVMISGRGSNMLALADACEDPAFPARIALVLSDKADAAGLARAAERGIATRAIARKAYPSRAAFDDAMHAALVEAGVERVCLAGFMRILGSEMVSRWPGKMLNIHPSLLPSFKGLDTHQRALDAGVTLHGATVHEVVPELDSGPIVAQVAVPVAPDDDADSLAARVLSVEHRLYVSALARHLGAGGPFEADAPAFFHPPLWDGRR